MKRGVLAVVVGWVCLAPIARADQEAPRDIWPQATAAIDAGDLDTAFKRANELTDLGKQYGIRNFPIYADSAAALARQATSRGNKVAADWGNRVSDQLDPHSRSVAFSKAEAASEQKLWARAVPLLLRGYANIIPRYRASLLSRSDFLIVIIAAVAVTAIVFAVALFVRYGRPMAHDFREILSRWTSGGAVTVLAVALLFLPIFVWLGPMWLVFYWFAIFFGYAGTGERVAIIVLALLVAAAPVALDLTAHWIAGVDSPVLLSAIASEEQSYYPDALHRLQELVNVVPDSATLHLLLGNLELQDGNEQDAAAHYRRSIDLHDNAGAHVNLGNLHFIDNDYSAAIIEYQRAEALDARLAIAFYNHSVASGELYRFDDQAHMLDQAKRIDRNGIERIMSNQASQVKYVMYRPPISEAWSVANTIAHRGVARTLFGNYSWFDPLTSAANPVTAGGLLAAIFAPIVLLKRQRAGFAGSCIKCGRTFCHRCKSARESTTYCTQCIHIYLKRDGVSVATKRSKLDEVGQHQQGMLRRNRLFATLLPGSAQMLEGRTFAGIAGLFLFAFFVCLALLIGRLAPVLGPGELSKLLVRVLAIIAAVVIWVFFTVPIYRRRAVA